jgi:sialic acid synthase SpsE
MRFLPKIFSKNSRPTAGGNFFVTIENIIGFKRPLNGLSVNYLEKIIGKTFSKAMIKDEALQYNSIEW